jgi:hypothetical protein
MARAAMGCKKGLGRRQAGFRGGDAQQALEVEDGDESRSQVGGEAVFEREASGVRREGKARR